VIAMAMAIREAIPVAFPPPASASGSGGSGGGKRGDSALDGISEASMASANPGASSASITSDGLEELPPCPTIIKGETIIDRKSEFVGFAARVTSEGEVAAVMAKLLSDKRIAKATHNMMAYRFRRRDGSASGAAPIWVKDNDEDGEHGAGSRMSALMDMANVEDACVVVTRWYGGVLLGPKRFAHISNC